MSSLRRNQATSVFTAAVISASAFFASAQCLPGGRPPDPRLSGSARRSRGVAYATSVFTAAVISASAFFASAQCLPGGRPPDPRLSGSARRSRGVAYATSVFTAAVISASAFFASAKYMLVLELAYSSLSMPA